MNLKRNDYIIISVICFFLGIAIISQVLAGKEYDRVIKPENNEIMALEVASLTKGNTNLRNEVLDLTSELNTYKNSSETSRVSSEKYQNDLNQLAVINGESAASGQGTVITIQGGLAASQVIDLINAINNIGSEVISINGQRIVLQMDLGRFSGQSSYEIKVLGNSQLLKSAIERRGGIEDQISSKDISISVSESSNMTIEAGKPLELRYARIVKE